MRGTQGIAVGYGAACTVLGLLGSVNNGPDWRVASAASRTLFAHPLDVYVRHPDAQMGPLALTLTRLPHPLFAVIVGAGLGVFLWLIRSVGARWLAAAGALLLLPWWRFTVEGHADDALVILAAVVMLTRRERPRLVGGAFAVAVAAKPTALLLAPLLLPASLPAAVVGFVPWLPFLAHPRALIHAGGGASFVWHDSLAHALGYPLFAPLPIWTRPVQLGLGLAVGWLLVRRGLLVEAMVAAFTIRALLEPIGWPAYSSTVLAIALLLPWRRVPWAALLAFGSWDAARGLHHEGLRMVLLLAVLTVVYRTTVAAIHMALVDAPDPVAVALSDGAFGPAEVASPAARHA